MSIKTVKLIALLRRKYDADGDSYGEVIVAPIAFVYTGSANMEPDPNVDHREELERVGCYFGPYCSADIREATDADEGDEQLEVYLADDDGLAGMIRDERSRQMRAQQEEERRATGSGGASYSADGERLNNLERGLRELRRAVSDQVGELKTSIAAELRAAVRELRGDQVSNAAAAELRATAQVAETAAATRSAEVLELKRRLAELESDTGVAMRGVVHVPAGSVVMRGNTVLDDQVIDQEYVPNQHPAPAIAPNLQAAAAQFPIVGHPVAVPPAGRVRRDGSHVSPDIGAPTMQLVGPAATSTVEEPAFDEQGNLVMRRVGKEELPKVGQTLHRGNLYGEDR